MEVQSKGRWAKVRKMVRKEKWTLYPVLCWNRWEALQMVTWSVYVEGRSPASAVVVSASQFPKENG